MKKTAIVILLFKGILELSAQTPWPPIGARMYYRDVNEAFNDRVIYRVIEITSEKDTVIDNKKCAKVLASGGRTVDYYSYLYKEDRKVYQYLNLEKKFILLMDFSLNKGQSYELILSSNPFTLRIDSTSVERINGTEKKVQYISGAYFFGKIIEDIGNTSGFFFPSSIEGPYGPLRCYEDSTIGLYKNPLFYNNLKLYTGLDISPDKFPCDTAYSIILTGSQDLEQIGIKVYPNPFRHALSVSNEGNERLKKVELLDLQGRILYSEAILPEKREIRLEAERMPPGLYLLRLNTDKRMHMAKVRKE